LSPPAPPPGARGTTATAEALNEESFGLLGAHLGHLFDMGVHEFGELGCVDRVLVGGIELGQDPAQYRAYHIGGQPRDPLSLRSR
jgi:hypothetical protein